jgi:predicted HicB family RNase H-like nuclease
MQKAIEAWLRRPYARRVVPAAGGGFVARVPQLGDATCVGFGDSEADALAALRESMVDYFTDLSDRGEEPPEAEPDWTPPVDFPSGRMALRLPRRLHAELKYNAALNGMSANSYTVALVARALAQETTGQAVLGVLDQELRDALGGAIHNALTDAREGADQTPASQARPRRRTSPARP